MLHVTFLITFPGTQSLQRQEARNLKKQNEPERQAKQKLREASRIQLVDPDQASAFIESDDILEEIPEKVDKDDFDYYIPEIKPKVNNTDKYDLFVSYGKRNGIKDHVLAGLLNCLRVDDGVTDPTKFVSTTKIRDEWQRINTKLTRNHNGISKVKAIKFDGKKTLSKLPHMKEKVIEKITCIMEPQGTYLDHFEPEDGSAYNCGAGLFKIVLKYDSLDSLLVIGGDNCPTNTSTYYVHSS